MSILFLDTEFTGLHQKTTLISLALVAMDGREFYAEYTDYDRTQLIPWISKNVLEKLFYNNQAEFVDKKIDGSVHVKGSSNNVKTELEAWLRQFDTIEIWADVPAWDWVLFCQLWGDALHIPKNIFYAPFDMATLLRLENRIIPAGGMNGDVSRFELLGWEKHDQHNALKDAQAEKALFMKLKPELI